MSRSKLEMLQSIELFSDVGPDALGNLAKLAIAKEYGPGDVLFLEGQPCQGLWIIGEGAAKVVKTTPQGRQLVLAIQEAPSTVAEVPVFDGGPYPASLVAIHQTTALLILKQDFLSLCQNNSALTLRFLRVFGRRLRQLVGLAERVTFGTIRQRLALDLLERSTVAGSRLLQLQETQEELANRLGTVREVVSRNLGRFQSEGLLKLDRRTVEILDTAGLRNEAETEL
ncbi:MAG: Crp/Fnr family transcriptional regulator [Acidobacteriota bacterium]